MDAVKQALSGLSWSAVLITAAVCGAATLLWSFRSRRAVNKKIQRARARRNESLQRAEQAVRQYKESHPMMGGPDILALSLPELTKQLRDGSLNPENVLYSYMEKTLEIHKKVNCCTGVLLESVDDVKTIDASRKGLLYGVPISIKDNYNYKNTDSSCGLVKFLDQPAKEDCVLVKVLKRQGAIPFVKTNVPQSMLNYDSSNPIYGQTVNPHNYQKTSGGSSSGEGALIAAGGSVLGFGTDIAGSVRIPASFCGISAFKPTGGRLSSKGLSSSCPGQKIVQGTAGPLARDVDSLALCMQALLCDHMFSLDLTVPPLPFNFEAYQSSKPLRVGYFINDGYTEPSPSMARGVKEVKALLEKAGHTMVPFVPVKLFYALTEICLKGLLADGGVTVLNNLKGGPLDSCLAVQVLPWYWPSVVKKILSIFLKPFLPRLAASLNALNGVGSVSNLWKQQCIVQDYIHETIAEWKRCNIDVLLCPVIGPAYNFLYSGKLNCALSYTILYNALNFPAGVVPVSTVTAEDEDQLKHYKGNYQDIWDKLFKQAVAGGEGLPVAVQCVALPWQDELCLRFMKEVEQLVKQNTK